MFTSILHFYCHYVLHVIILRLLKLDAEEVDERDLGGLTKKQNNNP